jgi:hypothetical protein
MRVMVLFAGSLGLAACGLPIDERVQTFDDVPYDLDAASTTTSTTIEPAPVTTQPGTDATSTTIVETRPVDIVYLLGSSGELQPVTLALPTPVTDRLLIEQLIAPPSGTGVTLRTEVERGFITGFSVDRGLAVVDLSPSVIDGLSSLEQRRAIAQVVLTLTLFTTNEGGIGQVSFTVGNDPISVYVPARGSNSDPGEPVAWSDFSSLLAGAPDTTTTTTVARATTTTSTTQPSEVSSTTTATEPTTTSTPSATTNTTSIVPSTTTPASSTSLTPVTTVGG